MIHLAPHPTVHNFKDITGQQFATLTVIGYAGRSKHGLTTWLCKCTCGVVKVFCLPNLKRSKSCGCMRNMLISKGLTVHGHNRKKHRTPEHLAYFAAKNRCQRKAERNYAAYGGRGIEFRFTDFQDFLDEIGLRPTPHHSLDRINNNGHYERGNVRWATRLEQAHNKRNTVAKYSAEHATNK